MRSQVRLCCCIGALTSCRVWKTPSSNPSLSFPLKLWMQPFPHVDAGSMYSVLDPHHPGPFPRNPGRRLRPVARADELSHAPDHRPAAGHLQHIGRPHAAAGPDSLTLPGAFADDRQQPCIYAVVESHLHEAACLKVVRPIGPQVTRCPISIKVSGTHGRLNWSDLLERVEEAHVSAGRLFVALSPTRIHQPALRRWR